MAQRRPITSHPLFVPLIALWFAALLGLTVAVLPAVLIENAFKSAALGGMVPLSMAGRAGASGVAALVGAAVGLAAARAIARRDRADPRPVYEDSDSPVLQPAPVQAARRPLHVREELADDLHPAEALTRHDEPPVADGESPHLETAQAASAYAVEAEDSFMILGPRRAGPPPAIPDLDGLLAQFDHALAAFRSDESAAPPSVQAPAPGSESPGASAFASASGSAAGPDPVHAFVARQTGAPAPSPLGGRMPDHQAELRAALDKLARAHRKD